MRSPIKIEKKIIVIGDVMLDRFVEGEITRQSPEASAPIVFSKGERDVLGGAANVAANIRSLGGKPHLFSIVGFDNTGSLLSKLLRKAEIKSFLLKDKGRPTTLKVRIFDNDKYLLRFDRESSRSISRELSKNLLKKIELDLNESSSIVFSDYNKGVLSRNLVRTIIDTAKRNNIPIVVDAKPVNLSWFKGVNVIKPNFKEALEMGGTKNIHSAMRNISMKTDSDVLVTMGRKGMLLYEKNRKITKIKGIKVNSKDIVGAGDVVAASLALGLASGWSLYESACFGNKAAAVSVERHGTIAVALKEVK